VGRTAMGMPGRDLPAARRILAGAARGGPSQQAIHERTGYTLAAEDAARGAPMEMTIEFPGGDRVDARFGGPGIVTNQDGSAPAPFELFLASIGTCAGFYVLRFCRQRGIPTEGLRILQRAEENAGTGMVGRIDLAIELPPGFPERYREAVIRSAQLCAVKKHLEHPPRIEVRAV
jgi:putative redox protein